MKPTLRNSFTWTGLETQEVIYYTEIFVLYEVLICTCR